MPCGVATFATLIEDKIRHIQVIMLGPHRRGQSCQSFNVTWGTDTEHLASYRFSASLPPCDLGPHSQVIQTQAPASKTRSRYSLHPLRDGFGDSATPSVALSTEHHYGCLDSVDTSTVVAQTGRIRYPRQVRPPHASDPVVLGETDPPSDTSIQRCGGTTPEGRRYEISVPVAPAPRMEALLRVWVPLVSTLA